jgi:endonuclease/exonuclease/phosphatase (EEP) superfamily protein YafD
VNHSAAQPVSRRRRALAALAASPFLAVIALAQLAGWSWLGEMCSHWTLHAAVGAIAVAIAAGRGSRLQALLVVATLAGIAPWVAAAHQPRSAWNGDAQPSRRIGVLSANLFDFNPRRAEARAALCAEPAAIIGLEEISREDEAALRRDPRWPHQHWTFRGDILDVALLSAYPMRSAQIHNLDNAGVLEALLDLDGTALRVLVVHLYAPRSPSSTAQQDRQLAALARLVTASREPVLAIGDFNLSAGTPRWHRFLAASGLARAPGREPATWPAALAGAGIAIDHLLGRGLALDEVQAFAIPGDDHRGVRGTLLLGEAAMAEAAPQ